jgi:hypothetical protein
MKFTEANADLFEKYDEAMTAAKEQQHTPRTLVVIAHCVSRDFVMGKGVATEFRYRYGRVNALIAQQAPVGGVAHLDDRVFYLVTKKRFTQKPSLIALRSSLRALAAKLREIQTDADKRRKDNNKSQKTKIHLFMPRIGCGLDSKLNWERDVRPMLTGTMIDVQMGTQCMLRNVCDEITICHI